MICGGTFICLVSLIQKIGQWSLKSRENRPLAVILCGLFVRFRIVGLKCYLSQREWEPTRLAKNRGNGWVNIQYPSTRITDSLCVEQRNMTMELPRMSKEGALSSALGLGLSESAQVRRLVEGWRETCVRRFTAAAKLLRFRAGTVCGDNGTVMVEASVSSRLVAQLDTVLWSGNGGAFASTFFYSPGFLNLRRGTSHGLRPNA